MEMVDKMEKANPENAYKYFPNDALWTWEQRHQEADYITTIRGVPNNKKTQ
jgi:hypothetical protein